MRTRCLQLKLVDTEFMARSKAEQLEKKLVFERAANQELREKLSKVDDVLLTQKEEAENRLERCKAFHQASLNQLMEKKLEIDELISSLIRSQDLLKNDFLRLQQEKTSMKDSLAFAEIENNKLVDLLTETEQNFRSKINQWQRKSSCHLEELQKYRHLFVGQMSVQGIVLDKLLADRLQWEQEKAALLEEDRASFLAQDMLEATRLQWENCRQLCLTELNQQQICNQTLNTALAVIDDELETESVKWRNVRSIQRKMKQKEDYMLAADRLQWEQEKASLLEEKRASLLAYDMLAADRLQSEQEKASLLEEKRASLLAQDMLEGILHKLEQEKASLLEENKASLLAQDMLAADRLQSEQEKASLLEENKASLLAQLDKKKMENHKLQTALKANEQELRSVKTSSTSLVMQIKEKKFAADRLQWEKEKASLLQEISASSVARLKEKKDEQKMENQELQSEKDTREMQVKEKKFAADRLQWEQEKASLLEEKRASLLAYDMLAADRLQSEQEKASLLEEKRASLLAQDMLEGILHKLEQEKASLLEENKASLLAQDMLAADCLQSEQEKASLLEENKASLLAQLDKKKMENHKLQTALKANEQELRSVKTSSTSLVMQIKEKKFAADCLQWEKEKASLLQEISASSVARLKEKKDEQKMENQELQSEKDTREMQVKEKKFAADRLQWEMEKASLLQEISASCVSRLKEKKEEVDHFIAATAEQHFEGFRDWPDEKATLLQTVEELKHEVTTLREENVHLKVLKGMLFGWKEQKRTWYDRYRGGDFDPPKMKK
ncbi:calponin homology domain-containing protein DDB_G0272472-like [Cebidichthys violaceus]|uniref:calponin homology domain-containing protein DDB_G0272472-like n=1 Tax=Cebidichthys violaceus TaxID=271503 RepID=UPI0035CB1EAE